MKKLLYIIFAVIGSLMFIQCSDWTEMEPTFTEPVNINGEEYYKALREYKKTKHPIVFGWYSEWTGTGINMNNQLRGIPDSMDIVSLWGGAFNLTEAQKSDLKEVREKKGTRILYCQHIMDIGRSHTPSSVEKDHMVDGKQYGSLEEAMAAYWGWYGNHGDTSVEGVEKAIRKYARVIIDSINKYQYDGFDIDYEPNYGYGGNISSYPDRMEILIDELSKEFGPKSGTGRIFMVDGEPQTLNTASGPLLDYYVIQAYYSSGDADLDNRFNKLLRKFGSVEDEATILRKTVWCEDFEKHKGDGGPRFTTRDGVVTYSLKGMALYYRPEMDTRIGGVGAYRFNLCRPINDYFFMREVIQVLNPAKH
ncbi:MAG: glycoside hydrolase family 18 [Bacteroides sp.]|uniref:glycoside hydrolase family 18 n=1 Tax=Bacteroides sp. TaxID=29523 RepID=UPI002FC8DDF5